MLPRIKNEKLKYNLKFNNLKVIEPNGTETLTNKNNY